MLSRLVCPSSLRSLSSLSHANISRIAPLAPFTHFKYKNNHYNAKALFSAVAVALAFGTSSKAFADSGDSNRPKVILLFDVDGTLTKPRNVKLTKIVITCNLTFVVES